jgi:type IV pilus assembly protein PilM
MAKNNTTSYFYHDKPVVGLDIGHSNIKVMQTETTKRKRRVVGYGIAPFDSTAVKDGVIINYEVIAKSLFDLFKKNLVGDITTRRVALAIPAGRAFNRTVTLPPMGKQDLKAAVTLEAEQYIPVPLNELYFDYSVISQSEKETELLIVAVPKKIVDSYMSLAKVLDLEVVAIETTIGSSGRLFVQAEKSNVPTVLIDLGSLSSDLTIYDKELVVTGTVPGGGDSFTSAIAQKLKVTPQEAHIIKSKYGLGLSKKQKEITECLTPTLDQLIKEIRRMVRYYQERSTSDGKIYQIVTMGGGANMPGLSEHLTNALRIPVRMCDPWQQLDFDGLQLPNSTEKSMYVTVAGLALMNPKEIFTV